MTTIDLSKVNTSHFFPREMLNSLPNISELEAKVQEVALKALAGMLIGAVIGAGIGLLLGAWPIVLVTAGAGAGLGLLVDGNGAKGR